jgi:hypothetical protein
MLFSREQLYEDFEEMKEQKSSEIETVLSEGSFHSGLASTILFTAIK